nr:odorant receptor 16 [Pachyrhinus yasumatsui]
MTLGDRENTEDNVYNEEKNNKNSTYPKSFFTATEYFMVFIAQEKLSKNTPKIIKVLYSLYNFCLISTAIIFIFSELVAFRRALGDTQKMVSQIGMMFTHLVGLGKLWILVGKRKYIDDIKAKLQDKQFQYKPVDEFQPGVRIRKEKFLSVFIATFIFCLYSFVGISAHISTVLIVRKNTIGETFIGNTSCEALLPYSYYYPFDVSTKTGCYYSLDWMDIALDIYAWYIATLDMIFVTLLHLLKTQLHILGEALRTIRKRCLDRLGLKKNFSLLYDTQHPRLEEEMYQELTHCTKHLMSLLEVRNGIEEIFTFITLAQTLASLLIFASCLFVAARVPVNSPNFLAQLEYFCAVLTQFSIYSWFGNQITLTCQSIAYSMYDSDWFSCSQRYKKSMILTMTRIQRPLYLSIGKFTPLALSTLLGVIRGSFSYFTVFQSVEVEQLE